MSGRRQEEWRKKRMPEATKITPASHTLVLERLQNIVVKGQ